MINLPPGYIDESIQGDDRKLLEIYYTGELSEGGSADEVILRGLKALLAHASQMVTTDFRALCAKVIAYYEGQGEYNFTNLNSNDRGNAAFDAWVNLRDEIKSALADTANDRLISAELAVAPVSVSEKPWEREGWCDADGWCWFGAPQIGSLRSMWVLGPPGELASHRTHTLPYWGIPLVKDDQP